MAGERLYLITYEEDGEEYQGVFPEYALPCIDTMVDITLCGYLGEGFVILPDEDPEDGDKDDVPTSIADRLIKKAQ